MQIVVFILVIFLLLSVMFIFSNALKNMSVQKRKLLIRRSVLMLLIISVIIGVSYIPKRIVTLKHTEVATIIVYDGNTDKEIEIIDKNQIKHIVDNLNGITFQRKQFTLFNMGYAFKVKFLDKDDDLLMALVLNSESTIRYKAFRYEAINHGMDYDYILEIFKTRFANYKQ